MQSLEAPFSGRILFRNLNIQCKNPCSLSQSVCAGVIVEITVAIQVRLRNTHVYSVQTLREKVV